MSFMHFDTTNAAGGLAGTTNVLVAETFNAPSVIGYSLIDTGGAKGSLTPSTFNGQSIPVFETVDFFWRVMMDGNNVPNTDAIWDQVVCEGLLTTGFGQVILVRNTAGYNPNDGPRTSWTFNPGAVKLVDTKAYNLRFTSTGMPFP